MPVKIPTFRKYKKNSGAKMHTSSELQTFCYSGNSINDIKNTRFFGHEIATNCQQSLNSLVQVLNFLAIYIFLAILFLNGK